MSEFDKWYKEKYYKYDLYPKYAQFRKEIKEAWQAATAESDKHIAELNAENKQIDAINSSLQTHINVLREALEIARDYQFDAVNQFHNDFAGYKDEKHEQYDYDLKLVENALVATPAQSLQEHDNEVIERCAKVCLAKANELKEFIDQDFNVGKADTGAMVCANAIRALIEKE